MEKFNLSEKIFSSNNQSKTFIELYNLKIILKEFIKILKEEYNKQQGEYDDFLETIDKHAGDELV